jgi:uncharacterized protein YbjQ (UPF0145 family)
MRRHRAACPRLANRQLTAHGALSRARASSPSRTATCGVSALTLVRRASAIRGLVTFCRDVVASGANTHPAHGCGGALRPAVAVADSRWVRPGRGGSAYDDGMTQPASAVTAGLPVTTALGLQGMTVERDLGVAFGLVVRSMGAIKSIGAGFKAMRQGEVTQYTELLEDSRRHAIDRMIENARLLGANAVIAMRFDSSEIGQQLTEIVAYGTAVIARPTG